jgi:hypothetical protein
MNELSDNDTADVSPAPEPARPVHSEFKPGFHDVPTFEELLAEYSEPKSQLPAEVPEPLDAVDELDLSRSTYEMIVGRGKSPEEIEAGDNLLRAYDKTRSQLEQYAAVVQREKDLFDFKAAVAKIRDDVPAAAGVNDDMLVGYLMLRYQLDPHTADAWDNRIQEPGTWQRRLSKLGQQLAEQIRPPIDAHATACREAVAAAVRGASRRGDSGGPELPSNLGDLSDAEFRAVQRRFGYESNF